MSSTTELSPFNERDFRAIEAAVLETEKGRWFLNEFGRRNRVADTQTLLSALNRLERNLTSQTTPNLVEHPDIAALSSAIAATRSDIGAVRNDMLKDRAEIPADTAVFSYLSENAHQISVDLIATAEALQGTIKTLRSGEAGTSHADAIDGHVHTLLDGGWRQDVLAQRISKAMGLLEHLDQSLKALAGKPATPVNPASSQDVTRSLPTALTQENLKFFDGDDDMFTVADKPGGDKPAKPNLEILKNEPHETAPEEPVVVQIAADDPPQDDATAIPEPASNATDEPAGQDGVQQAAEAQQAPVATFDEKPVEPNIVVIRRGKGAAAAEASSDTASDASKNDVVTDASSEAAEEASDDDVKTAPDDAAAEASNDVVKDAADDAGTDAADDAAAAATSKAPTAAPAPKISRVTSSLFKEKPEEDVWAKVTETASELSAGGAVAYVAEAEPADTPEKSSPDEVISVSKETKEETGAKDNPVAKDDQPSRRAAKAELTDMDLEAPAASVTNTAHSADDALSAFADIAASPVEADAQPQAQAAGQIKSKDVKTDETDREDGREDKERIVVIRRSTSEETEIPFADYLGVEPQPEPQPEPQSKTGSTS